MQSVGRDSHFEHGVRRVLQGVGVLREVSRTVLPGSTNYHRRDQEPESPVVRQLVGEVEQVDSIIRIRN
jgi:hypothetical protein